MRQAFDETGCEWVGGPDHDDWDRGGCGCRGLHDNGALGHDDVYRLVVQCHSQLRELCDIAIAPFRDHDKIAFPHIAALRKRGKECVELAFWRGRGTQKTDAAYLD